jgi:hypothetical protein
MRRYNRELKDMGDIGGDKADDPARSARVLAKVLIDVEKGVPVDVAYNLAFGAGAYERLAADIREAANKGEK